MAVLYISYTGLMEPLGQSQVYQYLRRLAEHHPITLVSYEKPSDWANRARRASWLAEVHGAGIRWVPLRYHKRPSLLATSYDLAVGFFVCAYLLVRYRIGIVHARSYVPAVLALLYQRILGTRFVFDTRSFLPDERVDSGSWRRDSVAYRLARWFEQRFLTHADVVVCATHAGAAAMQAYPYMKDARTQFDVITTCTDLDLFRAEPAGHERPFTLGYVGKVGAWYLFDPALECFKILRELRPDAQLVIINRDEHAVVQERLQFHGIPPQGVELKALEHAQVPAAMAGMDAGIFFIQPLHSKLGSSPTKLGEFLACGVPCLTNAGVGDVERIVAGSDTVVLLREFERQAQVEAVRRLLELAADPETPGRCVRLASSYFSLQEGVRRYDEIYRRLNGRHG